MPRGNLETLYPRALLLSYVRKEIDRCGIVVLAKLFSHIVLACLGVSMALLLEQ